MSGRIPCPCGPGCPDRSAECRKSCPKWAPYEEQKRAEYHENEIGAQAAAPSPAKQRAAWQRLRAPLKNKR